MCDEKDIRNYRTAPASCCSGSRTVVIHHGGKCHHHSHGCDCCCKCRCCSCCRPKCCRGWDSCRNCRDPCCGCRCTPYYCPPYAPPYVPPWAWPTPVATPTIIYSNGSGGATTNTGSYTITCNATMDVKNE